MTTWKDGGQLGQLREIANENGHTIYLVLVQRAIDGGEAKPWPEGEANFRLILKAPQMLEALEAIAEGAIVSPDQSPREIAESALRVLQLVREQNLEYLLHISTQQKRAERAESQVSKMLEALEKIAALETPRWPSLAEVADIYEQSMKIARAAIAAVKGENNETG